MSNVKNLFGATQVQETVDASIPDRDQFFDAASFQATEANVPELNLVTGTNLNFLCKLYSVNDESTFKAFVPSKVESGSTLSLRIAFSAVTAAASKNVQFRFGYYVAADDDTWDAAYTNIDSSDIAVNSVQDDLQIATWTATLPAAFAEGALAFYSLSRIAASANELVGAVRVLAFQPEIARA